MIKKFSLNTIFLILILALAFVLRVYRLSDVPTGFFADEASIGYNAYNIVTKGTDEYEFKYPIFFKAFGEYKGPVQIYSTVPSIATLGLNEFSTRLPSAFFGSFGILVIYFLTKKLFKNHQQKHLIALVSALFLAISPWHIQFSRTSLEGLTPFIFFTTLATFLFLKSLKNVKLLFLSVLAFVLAIYSYFPARIFIPLLSLTLIASHFNFFIKYKKIALLSTIILVILLIPFLQTMISKEGWTRWQQVSIFSQPPKNQTIITHIFNNYLSHFSPDFLFLKGDIDMPGQFITRHSVRGVGELYLFQLPLVIFGLVKLFKYKKALFILSLWILLYPLGSAFTTDQSAQATRSIIGIIPFQIITALGVVFLLELTHIKKVRYLIIVVLTATVFVSFTSYLRQYFIEYPLYSSDYWGWQYGPREIMSYFLNHKQEYDEMFMSGEYNAGHIFIPFYDPKNSCQNKCKLGDLLRNKNIYNPYKKQVFAQSPELLNKSEFKDQFKIKHTIYYPDGKIAFLIGEVTKLNTYAKLPQI